MTIFLSKQKIPIFRKPPVMLIIDSETSQAYSSMQLSDKNENELLPLSDSSHCYQLSFKALYRSLSFWSPMT